MAVGYQRSYRCPSTPLTETFAIQLRSLRKTALAFDCIDES